MTKTYCPSLSRFSLFLVTIFFVFLSAAPLLAQLPVVKGPQGQIESPFAKVYEKVAPAVVKIDVETKVDQSPMQLDPFWRQFFNIPQQQQQQQKQQKQPGVGSGVIVDRDGRILTNNHVVKDATKIEVVLNDKERYDAEVVGTDPGTDLAVIKLKLNGKQLPANYVAEIGDSDQLRPGDYAVAIGNPLGLDRTVTVGVISALGRSGFSVQNGPQAVYQDFIQTDAQINPGNSGGALCDINGRVIGINDMYTAQYAGIGFAIPSNLAKSVMGKLIASGKVERGYLGIMGEDIDNEKQDALGLSSSDGVLISTVQDDSPAKGADLKVGDVIVALDGSKVKNYNDFRFKIAAKNPGDTAKLDLIRDGAKKTVTVKLGNRSSIETAGAQGGESKVAGEASWRGIHFGSLNREQNLPENIKKGVVVVQIDENSPAASSNLEEGDIITEIRIEKTKQEIVNVKDVEALKEQYKNSKRPMLIYRIQRLENGQTVSGYVTVKSE